MSFSEILCFHVLLDEITVELEDVKEKLEHLESQIQLYEGTHKTSSFYNIHDTKNELLFKLDQIELYSQEDLRKARRELYQRLETLSTQLNSKIHEEDLECSDCLKRIIIVPEFQRT